MSDADLRLFDDDNGGLRSLTAVVEGADGELFVIWRPVETVSVGDLL